jgi:transcriptional regulator of acetoin/glycerol metabolism
MIRHPAGARHWTRRKPELIKRGAQSHAAKLSADDIERLYRFADAGWQPSELASHFGVTRITVWRHLRSRLLHM